MIPLVVVITDLRLNNLGSALRKRPSLLRSSRKPESFAALNSSDSRNSWAAVFSLVSPKVKRGVHLQIHRVLGLLLEFIQLFADLLEVFDGFEFSRAKRFDFFVRFGVEGFLFGSPAR